MDLYDVVVIGGGASGLMAAGRAAELGGRVLLLEKNKKLGEKLKITGGGRCNITNAEYDTRALLAHYGDSRAGGRGAGSFLFSAFSQFGVKDTFSFFESRGLPLIVEGRKRTFPKSQKALDVYKVLEKYVQEGKVTIKVGSPVTKVNFGEINDGGTSKKIITIVYCSGPNGVKSYRAKSFIFATGGASHKETGSTGDGFGWLRELGHTVVSPTPSIVPLAVSDEWSKKLAGISVESAKITFFIDGVKAGEMKTGGAKSGKPLSKKGRILFTHFGISGPLILNSAAEVADLLQAGTVTAAIDIFPDFDLGALEKKVIGVFDANKNKTLKNVLAEILPAGTAKGISMLLEESSIEERANTGSALLEKKVHSVTVEERKNLTRIFKALPLTITGLMGDDRAVVSDGGVELTEIDMRTMKSKVVDNLFVTGDLLHMNRPSGGYSLQLCWTSGFVAGEASVQNSHVR